MAREEPWVRRGHNGGNMTTLHTFSRRCATLVLAASLCSGLLAQMDPTPTPTQPSPDNSKSALSHHDRAFLSKAAKAGMKEIAVSQAVMDHLSSPQLKQFAQTMVTDHSAANTELMTLAASKNFELPPQDPAIMDEWSKKTGDIDRKYVKEMVSDHEDAVKLFEKASKSEDPDIAAFAQKTLPTLQHHLMMAQDLKTSID
jgi:putative membrane protein